MSNHQQTYTGALPSQSLDAGTWLLVSLMLGYSLFTANPILSLYAWVVLLVNFFLVWVPGYPPILFFILAFQWLQASTRILQANLAGIPLNTYGNSIHAQDSVYIALTAVLILGLSFRLVLQSTRFDLYYLYRLLLHVNLHRALFAFLGLMVFLPALNALRVGGLSQIIYAMQSLEWAAYVLVILACLAQQRQYWMIVLVFSLKFILGFSSYFSDFKEPIIVTAIALGVFWNQLKISRILLFSPLAFLIFSLFVVWTGVKKEYRMFLSGGENQQVVRVSTAEALDYLGTAITQFEAEEFNENIDISLDRLQYTRMIQYTMDYIPLIRDHSEGKIWMDAVLHIFTPRILFPNKPVLDDSEIAREYTGLDWQGREKGSSISIGYVAEAYADFGRWGLYLPIFLLGLFVAWVHKLFLNPKSLHLLLNVGAIIPILLQFQLLEKSTNKIIGGVLMSTLVYIFIVQRFIYPLILNWVYQPRNNAPHPPH